jgi:hypothetical protein
MGKFEQIKEAIEKAIKRESKLTKESLEVPSLTSLNIRHLYNNLGSISNIFCEIGSHRGGSYCSFVTGNGNLISATAIDNFSENFNNEDTKRELLYNMNRFTPLDVAHQLIDKDCFSITEEDFAITDKIDLYLYDGNHSEESQYQGLIYFLPFLADEFIFLVDDYSWEDVRNGTQRAIKDSGVEVLYEQAFYTPEGGEFNEHWHNGTYLALLKKK